MRHALALVLAAASSLISFSAAAEEPPVSKTTGVEARPALAPRSEAVAITLEVVNPIGGVGCLYRRRYLAGALVLAGSVISGGTLIYAGATSDRDGVILNAVALAVVRAIGIAAVARSDHPEPDATPDPPRPPVDPPEQARLFPVKTVGLSHAFAF